MTIDREEAIEVADREYVRIWRANKPGAPPANAAELIVDAVLALDRPTKPVTAEQRYCVVCSRSGVLPQVVGPFADEDAAGGWVRDNWQQFPPWAFSVACFSPSPGQPVNYAGITFGT